MDAKAKVVPVAWQYRWAGELPDGGRANWHEASEDAYRDQTHSTMGYEYRALVDLTDHEAALAKLKSERDAWQRLAGEWQQATERRKKKATPSSPAWRRWLGRLR